MPASPWGTPVLASDHGSSRDDQTVLIKLPEGRKYESLSMMVSLSPTLQRQVLEALGEAALEEHAEWILMHRERPLEQQPLSGA